MPRSSRPRNVSDPRLLAYEILQRVEQGAYADLALDEVLRRRGVSDPRDRGLLTELVYGVLRKRGRLDYALARHCRQPLGKLETKVLQILRLGAYQVLELERIPPSAAVNTSVNLARQVGLQRASGFINGVLRGLLRGLPRLIWPDERKNPLEHLQHVCSLPHWLAKRWLAVYGAETAIHLAVAQLQPALLSLRCNTLKVSREELLAYLERRGIAARACRFAAEGVVLDDRRGLEVLPADWFQVQDEASMLVAPLLGVQPGETILDCCAAPGGKTTHLAALGDNRLAITALDLHPQRVELIRAGARRLGCAGVDARVRDMTQSAEFPAPAGFDRVLVDAPCSGLGVLRHNPETRWRRKPESLGELSALQSAILGRAAELLKAGGVLVYSVCTVTEEETGQVLEGFLAAHPQFVLEDLREVMPQWAELCDRQGCLSTWPRHPYLDGFFAARLRRRI
ncbi:16S rRNA (cytosine(967)-C(5))-methyltransferase RsmB [Geothermobacter hydrogeniphilus]|uniref:16S rRNA (cytosine(967)-C(5))-methyltransferase n=1 Tax=Geothermobacter hydrogeniphilus TaxID=1969733 RepID=A0A2K2HEK4_9BACT|nr:16S rRNA (cytosine(967)-C(5))-methyltransferase RsmB [Geothermobacter hydrogeniphilus]PNU21710.1 16S rRNA (cytosine(967)-C(5))-methyltransferase RsmB [Geothermobacter hydrogeniphilus]